MWSAPPGALRGWPRPPCWGPETHPALQSQRLPPPTKWHLRKSGSWRAGCLLFSNRPQGCWDRLAFQGRGRRLLSREQAGLRGWVFPPRAQLLSAMAAAAWSFSPLLTDRGLEEPVFRVRGHPEGCPGRVAATPWPVCLPTEPTEEREEGGFLLCLLV